MNQTGNTEIAGILKEPETTIFADAQVENDDDQDREAREEISLDTAIDLVLEWLAKTIVEDGDLATRGLASAAYDSLGAIVALSWDRETLWESMQRANAATDGAVCLPAIKSVIAIPRL